MSGRRRLHATLAFALLIAPELSARGDGTFQRLPGLELPAGFHPAWVTTGSFDGSGRGDVVATSYSYSTVQTFLREPGGAFAGAELLAASQPTSLVLADLDGDGTIDITTASAADSAVTVTLGSPDGLQEPVTYKLGVQLLGHRLADMDGDGAIDLVAFGPEAAVIVPGTLRGDAARPFRRGDADGSGALSVTDAILVLDRLIRGGSPIACGDAGDANQDGKVDLSDAVVTLGYLFLGAQDLECGDAADADDSGEIEITDPVFLLGALFLGQREIPSPRSNCGPDPSADAVGCRGSRC